MTLQRLFFWILAWALAGFSLPLRAQDSAARMDSLVSLMASLNRFTGSVLVYEKGRVVLDKAYGWQDAGAGKRNSSASIYQIYSITKSFTATEILMLVEQGRLSLDDHLSKFYPKVSGADQITILHLLSHRSGLFEFTRRQDTASMSLAGFVSLMEQQPLDFAPGTQWAYCNSGYWFLGLIIEKITGLSYAEAITHHIFKPLGMAHSGFNYKNLRSGDKSTGYAVFEESKRIPAETYAPPGPYAAGDIWSTTGDLLLFHQAMQDHALISAAMTQKAYTPIAQNYGLGWMTDAIDGKKIVQHSGGAAGFRSFLIRIPEEDICIIVLGNSEHDINGICGKLNSIIHHKPAHIPVHIQVSLDKLRPYEGYYQMQQHSLILQVYVESGRLVVQPARQPRTVLFTETPDSFYVEELDGFIRFLASPGGADTLALTARGEVIKAPRIQVTWGITGSATAKGWEGPDIRLQQTAEGNVWEIRDVELLDGEIKFRLNNNWDFNYGINSQRALQMDGENIVVQKGKYDIQLDLRFPENPSFSIKRK